jgi:hypothetical protein
MNFGAKDTSELLLHKILGQKKLVSACIDRAENFTTHFTTVDVLEKIKAVRSDNFWNKY